MNENNKSLITMLSILAIIIIIFLATYFGVQYFREQQRQQQILERTLIYNNRTYTRENLGWSTLYQIGQQQYYLSFYYSPKDIENITIDNSTQPVTTIKNFRITHPRDKVYITVDPSMPIQSVIAAVEIAKILGKGYNLYNMDVSSAVTVDLNDSRYPVIQCHNANNNTLVIWITIEENNSNSISSEGNCVILKARNANETVLVADALSYRLLNLVK